MMNREWGTARFSILGLGTLLLLVLGLGVWGTQARIAGAIVASGVVEVEMRQQVVQHAVGGVVSEILVDDGDLVEAGEVLLRIDGTQLQSELSIVLGQLDELSARTARLSAERDGLSAMSISPDVSTRAKTEAKLQELISGQERLLVARLSSIRTEVSQLEEQKAQIHEEIGGQNEQLTALDEQIVLVAKELADLTMLFKKGLAQSVRVSATQRESARLRGLRGELTASIARNRGRIVETDIRIAKLGTARRESAIAELRDIVYQSSQLEEHKRSILETLSQLDLRAPTSGMVHGVSVHTLKAVIRAAEPILSIVPQGGDLIVSARVALIDVDAVYVGQETSLRFSAFDTRTSPELLGIVSLVSPDTFTDNNTGVSFYQVELLIKPGELEKLQGNTLIPGMPVETYIQTGERSPLEYLIKPFSDYFNKAFRE